jgi:hypothetical protein
LHKILVGKPEGNGPFGKPRSRWEDNIRMNLSEIMWEDVDWIHVVYDKGPVAGSLERGSEP